MNLNWGTFDYHCNAHLDNLLILPKNEKKLYLAPLDFDLGFLRSEFIDLNYKNLISKFLKMESKPSIEYGESFLTINFGEYRDSQVFNDLKFKNNDFYDHIIFTLLNINSNGTNIH